MTVKFIAGLFLLAASGACANSDVQAASHSFEAETTDEDAAIAVGLEDDEVLEFAYCYRNLEIIPYDAAVNGAFCSMAYGLNKSYRHYSGVPAFGSEYVVK